MDTAILANRDYVMIIDRSGSMTAKDTSNGRSRWDSARESTLALANKVNEFDPDGLTLYLFNDVFKKFDNVTPERINQVWDEYGPMGSTSLSPVLKDVQDDYLRRKKAGKTHANGQTVIILTDGQPDDQDEVARVIAKFTQSLDNANEFKYIAVQLGKDAEATTYLNRLDDHLPREGAKYDIVSVFTMDDLNNRPILEVLSSEMAA